MILKKLSKHDLVELAEGVSTNCSCGVCGSVRSQGWESVPGTFPLDSLKPLGTLRIEEAPECWDEFHPNGTNFWSTDAPISIAHHPYNKCDIYACGDCGRKYLRYTEYGGYYLDERIRTLSKHLIV